MSALHSHIRDVSGATIASFVATVFDGFVYALLVHTLVAWHALSLGPAAGLAAVIGGVIHYLISRFWVFRRFQASLGWSVVSYFLMSGLAAVGHGLLTAWLASTLGAAFGWGLSKAVIWLLWTYPASRFIVFGGLASHPPRQKAQHVDL